jgi:hypothetical protein
VKAQRKQETTVNSKKVTPSALYIAVVKNRPRDLRRRNRTALNRGRQFGPTFKIGSGSDTSQSPQEATKTVKGFGSQSFKGEGGAFP